MLTPFTTTMASAAPEVLTTAPSALSSLANNVNFVGSAWIVSSALLTTYSTTRFLKFEVPAAEQKSGAPLQESSALSLPRPSLLTLYRFGGSLLLGLLAHPDFHTLKRVKDTWEAVSDFALPAAFLFLANFANSISLDRIGISLTYTTKCAIPLVTVLLTLVLDGAKALPRLPVLLSLIPIAAGIAAASWDHPHFELTGFLASLVSLTAQSALNVSSKHVMTRTGIAGPEAQRAMVAVGFAITSVMSLFQIATSKASNSLESKAKRPPVWLSSMAVIAYHVEYVLSFMFVKLVAPITYGASDAIRRLGIIISGHYMFGGHPFSAVNIMGIALALFGALSYSVTSHV